MLKRILTEDEYKGLPDNLQENYTQTETDDGVTHLLQVEGMTHDDDLEGLRSALDKERGKAKDAEAEAKAKQKELDEQAEQFNSQIAAIEAEKDLEITELSEQLDAKENQSKAQQAKLCEQMGDVLRDKAAIQAINSHHGNLKFLLPELQKELVAVIDEDGNARIEAKNAEDDDGKPLTAHALVAKMRKDPDYGAVFRGSGSSGSGIISDSSDYTTGGANRFKGTSNQNRSQMSPREKVDYIKEHGDAAYQALPL